MQRYCGPKNNIAALAKSKCLKTCVQYLYFFQHFFGSQHFSFENLLPTIVLVRKIVSSTKSVAVPRISAFSSRKTSYGNCIAYFNTTIAWSPNVFSSNVSFENLLHTIFFSTKFFFSKISFSIVDLSFFSATKRHTATV